MQLLNTSKNKLIAQDLQKAESFWSRFVGLLGKNKMPENTALWIDACNGIHTCFMRFEIDAVFVDKDLRVESIYSQIRPWRFVWGKKSAVSVIELKSGRANELKIEVGDQLHVVH